MQGNLYMYAHIALHILYLKYYSFVNLNCVMKVVQGLTPMLFCKNEVICGVVGSCSYKNQQLHRNVQHV